jgi:hypothetical protein
MQLHAFSNGQAITINTNRCLIEQAPQEECNAAALEAAEVSMWHEVRHAEQPQLLLNKHAASQRCLLKQPRLGHLAVQ